MRLTKTVDIDIPDGPVCENWAYRTFMPPEQKYRCSQLRDDSTYISARDAQSSGLGFSGGIISAFRCAFFDAGLRHQNGVGPFKCEQCLRAAVQQTETVDARQEAKP